MNTKTSRKELMIYSLLMVLAISLGAFGAHYFEKTLTEKALKTYKTGNLYHFYQVTSLFIIYFIERIEKINLKASKIFLMLGLILFSGNCYLYAITGIKTFAMIVPLGGLSFILAWLFCLFCFSKKT